MTYSAGNCSNEMVNIYSYLVKNIDLFPKFMAIIIDKYAVDKSLGNEKLDSFVRSNIYISGW